MATTKTLFDAVEAELRNAQAAINNAGAYMDMVKDAVNKIERFSGMKAPLSLSSNELITLFDVVERKLRNVRTAFNSIQEYMNMIKDVVNKTEESTGMESPLSLSSGNPFTGLMVKTESGKYGIPIAIKSEDESLIYVFKIRGINKELKEYLKPL